MTEKKEFRSKVEDLVNNVKELRFPSSAGFRPYQHLFCEDAISHPAKANLYMLHYLIEKYTEEGEVVADVMAGTGSSGIVASYLGRHSVLVELEDKFVEWIKKNTALLESHGKKKGEIKVIQGDARHLTELLGVKADYIVTSPPYSDSRKATKISEKDVERKIQILEKGAEEGIYNSGGKSYRTPGRIRWLRGWLGEGFSESKENIANLSHGDIDAVITSPPYSEVINKHSGGKCGVEKVGVSTKTAREYAETENNIGNLKHGSIDAIVTSPPYADSKKQPSKIDLEREVSGMETDTRPDTKNRHTPGRVKAIKTMLNGYGENEKNIGNLPLGEVDAIVTSPPYSGSAKGSDRKEFWERLADDPASSRFGRQNHPHTAEAYSESKGNIGNLPHGEIDAIVTSPPYSESMSKKRKGHSVYPNLERTREMPQETRDDNIANLYHGDIDAIITSPPYEGSVSDDKEGTLVGADERKYGRWRKGTAKKQSYTQHEEPCKIDTIITSPPYEGSLEGSSRHTRGGIASRDPALAQSGTYATTLSFGVPVGYSPRKDNIGNLKSNEEEYKALEGSCSYDESEKGS